MPTKYTTTTTAPAGTTTTGRKKSSGAAALAKSKAKGPGLKWAEWRASSGERWGVARARVAEQFSKVGATMKYGVFTVTHPMHPIRRKAAKESEVQKIALAKDRRIAKEAAVHSTAAAKRAQAREAQIRTLNQAV